MSRLQALGARGEQLAAAFLEQRGLSVVARNVRSSLGELDIVARDGDEMVFVEVKTRIGGDDVAPDVAVTSAKLERLGQLAERYVARSPDPHSPWRVDVVAIVISSDGSVRTIEHLEGAFH